jgi:hypothetical protein
MKLADLLATHSVTVSVYDGTTYNNEPLVIKTAAGEVGTSTITTTNQAIELVAKAKGTATVKLTLKKIVGNVEVSSYNNFAITVIDSGAVVADSYAVADIAKVHASDATRGAEVKVTAKLSNGTEVTLPKSAYTVNAIGDLQYAAADNKVFAGDVFEGSTDYSKTKKASFIVNIVATGASIVKEVTIVNEKPVPTTFELKSVGTTQTVSEGAVLGTAANVQVGGVFTTVNAKDQFGATIAIALNDFYANISDVDGVSLPANNGASAEQVTVIGLEQGKGYTVTFTS